MNRFERINDMEHVIRAALKEHESEQWTALPAIVHQFDADKHTLHAQPALKMQWANPDGSVTTEKMPIIQDIPLMTPRGGGASLTFPIKAGDECLLIFADRCIDHWWAHGGYQRQAEARMHDLSDGFAILGPFSQPQRVSHWNTDAVELRANDGHALISLNPTTHDVLVVTIGNVNITTTKDIVMTALGDVVISGKTVSINP